MSQRSRAFADVKIDQTPLWDYFGAGVEPTDFAQLRQALDYVHIDGGLVAAYGPDYPLVEPRELVPPLDSPLIEHSSLPAFTMVLLDRPLSYQDESFQFDMLAAEGRPVDPTLAAANRQTFRGRLPRSLWGRMEQIVGRRALTPLANYPDLLELALHMDRAHVLARDHNGEFRMLGVFASLPSDLDGEIKRFGRHIGKFSPGDNEKYAANRLFVYRFLMEQTALPICGERHTSAALFARRLMQRRERFCIKVLGHSDRAVTSLTSEGVGGPLPQVDKVALIQASSVDAERLRFMRQEGYFLDPARQVVILRVRYQQHAYHHDNVMEDRACSVLAQEIIHPLNGAILADLDILGLNQDRLLQLNDIVRGEHRGDIVYRGREMITSTEALDDRLRFLAAWLQKNRFQIADYSPDHFDRIIKVVSKFLNEPTLVEPLERREELVQDIQASIAELRVSHRLRLLEKLVRSRADSEGRKLQHLQILVILNHFLATEGEALAEQHPKVMRKLLRICLNYLDQPYLRRQYLAKAPKTDYDNHVLDEYERLTQFVEWCQALVGR